MSAVKQYRMERVPLESWVRADNGEVSFWFQVFAVVEFVNTTTGQKVTELRGVDVEGDQCSFAELNNTPIDVMTDAQAKAAGMEVPS